ncbi:D-alanyl-D-alanine carboxypeptidase family protein [Verrucomicrobiota bacterium]
MMKNRVFAILAAAAVISISGSALAANKRVRTPYYSAVAVEAETGRVLVADRAREAGYPASVTKLMTFLLYLEKIERGEVNLSDKVYVSEEAQKIGGRQVWLEANEIFTIEEMFYALMIHSANDVARALALHTCPTRDAFVAQMNARAQQLGMFGARYVTESGLPPGGGKEPDTANAMDISILAREVLKHPLALRFSGTKYITFRNGTMDLRSSNKLLGVYPGLDGLKTGYHGLGGWSIATTAERDGERIVAVVLGSPDRKTRDRAATLLMDKAFTKLAEIRATEPKPAPVIEPVQAEPIAEEVPVQEEVVEEAPAKPRGGRWVVISAVLLIAVGAVGLLRPKEKSEDL